MYVVCLCNGLMFWQCFVAFSQLFVRCEICVCARNEMKLLLKLVAMHSMCGFPFRTHLLHRVVFAKTNYAYFFTTIMVYSVL